MGIDAGDYNGDGLMDIFVTNFSEETNNLYRNNGDGTFTDTIYEVNLGDLTYLPVGFGTGFFDYDNDSDLDIFVANGHVTEHIHLRSDLLTYGQRNQLFQNDGRGKFVQMSPELEKEFLTEEEISRGSIFADYDNDGDVDLLVTQLNQPIKLYRNQASNREKSNNWLQIKVGGVRSNRNGFGAKVTLLVGNLSLTKETRSSSGYLSSHDPRLAFGIGQYQKIESLTIHWPSGTVQRLENISVNQQITVVEEVPQ
ncbi:TPA: CRTAC1 family protein [Candidatus Poribacteria bacterium]|nr:CRTAC1 family protein [Candidatus Poribacteria bacterium]